MDTVRTDRIVKWNDLIGIASKDESCGVDEWFVSFATGSGGWFTTDELEWVFK